MNLKNHITALLFTLIFSVSCVSQQLKETYTSKYALDFNIGADSTIVYQWGTNTYCVSTKHGGWREGNTMLLTSAYAKDSYKDYYDCESLDLLRTEHRQQILLPIHKEKNGKISFTSMGGSIDTTSFLTVEGISKEEKTLFSKNIKFYHKELETIDPTLLRRTTVSANIPLTDVELLKFNIKVRGKKRKEAIIVLCKLDIFIRDQHIDEFPIRKLPPIQKDLRAEAIEINLGSNNDFDKIKELKSSKIIGLGESIHGSSIVNQFAYKLIMQQVEKQNCKLVMIEKGFEKILPYNRYIMDDDFVLDKDLTEDIELMSLLEDLKRYNSDKSLKDKVRIFGMDYNYSVESNYNTLGEIFDYVTFLNSKIKAEELDQFALLLINFSWNEAFSFLRKNKTKMEKYFPFGEYESIMHIMNISLNMGPDIAERRIKRDSVMFANSKFLIDRFSPDGTNAVIYGHSLHINPISIYPALPRTTFGSFMKKEYSQDYSTLSILVGEGYNMANRNDYSLPSLYTKGRLSTPPIGSMEYFLNSLGKDLMYLPLTPDFDRLVLARNKGSHHIKSEFYPVNLYQRYDGVFFIKNIETSSEQKNDIHSDEVSKKYNDKVLKREKISKEIKKRLKKNN